MAECAKLRDDFRSDIIGLLPLKGQGGRSICGMSRIFLTGE